MGGAIPQQKMTVGDIMESDEEMDDEHHPMVGQQEAGQVYYHNQGEMEQDELPQE